jgi:hypothetical protein
MLDPLCALTIQLTTNVKSLAPGAVLTGDNGVMNGTGFVAALRSGIAKRRAAASMHVKMTFMATSKPNCLENER